MVTVSEVQTLLQDTSRESDSDDDEQEHDNTTPLISHSPVPTAKCSSCDESFPINQMGADFIYAMLCEQCFTNKHKKCNGEFTSLMQYCLMYI
jgi:hypothetical protein